MSAPAEIRNRPRVLAFIALMKLRIIELLLVTTVPTMVLVGPDGRILESTPHISINNLEQRIRHWQAVLSNE